jgi:thiol-disulfide isomerase/thioredoxin
MVKYLFLVFVFYATTISAQVQVIRAADLEEKIADSDADLTVFNFWATWCGPCIKELPHFDELESNYKNVKVYLVSIDFKNQLDRVRSFVEKKELKSEVLFIDEKDPEVFMNKVSDQWTGAIPATLFVTDLGKTYFHESAFTKEELIRTIEKYLN